MSDKNTWGFTEFQTNRIKRLFTVLLGRLGVWKLINKILYPIKNK
ncbi:hypothetical protein J22TS1_43920 [Siminovitchia terrae]|nr:hypothetical protein J22TS1_43920 [Siminovitchia terrae]